MKEKLTLNPNCSEQTLRIDLSNLNEEEKKALQDLVDGLEDDEEWYDTYSTTKDIFGTPVLEIDGATPYNNQDWLEDMLKKLPFWGKVRYEYDNYR